MTEFLERTYFQNSVRDYLIAAGIIIVGFLLVSSFKKLVLIRLKRWASATETSFDNYIVESLERFGIPALYFAAIYIGISFLHLSARVDRTVKIATTVAITILVVRFFSTVIRVLLQSFVKRQTNGEEKVKQIGGLMIIINIVIWLIGVVFLFDNMGYDVTAVVTGLGIGGIAVALAAQNILGDLFNYFVIFFDRPFEIGDFIIVDDKLGVVENIGIKTTRVKSLSGEQVVLSNSDLTSSRIHNYKRMERRRVVFKIGVIYQTTYEQMKAIPEVLKSIVLEQEMAEFDRAHFASYGDFSLDFEVVYYVLSSDFNVHMDVKQTIFMRIFEEFQKMGVEFAYPTQTIFLTKEGAEPVKAS